MNGFKKVATIDGQPIFCGELNSVRGYYAFIETLIGELTCVRCRDIISSAKFARRSEKNSAAGNEITAMKALG